MKADDFGWLVGGFFTIVLPAIAKKKQDQRDIQRKMQRYEEDWKRYKKGEKKK